MEPNLSRLNTDSGWVFGISWHPDGTKFATCSDNSIKIWDSNGNQLVYIENMPEDWISGISWHPDGTKFATCSGDQSIKIWDSDGNKLVHIENAHPQWINGISWHPDGTKFATCCDGIDLLKYGTQTEHNLCI